jgi:hypothetical protein
MILLYVLIVTAVRKLQGRNHFENLSIDWILILKRAVEKFIVWGV